MQTRSISDCFNVYNNALEASSFVKEFDEYKPLFYTITIG